MDSIVFVWVREWSKPLKVHAAAREYSVSIRKKITVYKELTVFRVLEEYPLHLFKSDFVQSHCYFLGKARILDSSPESRNVSDKGHSAKTRSQSSINVRLDGITKNNVRLYLFYKTDILKQQHSVSDRIHAMTSNLYVVILAAKFYKVVYAFAVRAADMHFVTICYQPFHQFKTKIVNHHIVVDKEKDSLLLHHPTSIVF